MYRHFVDNRLNNKPFLVNAGGNTEALFRIQTEEDSPYFYMMAEYGSILVICSFEEEIPRKVIKKTEVQTF